MLKTRLTRGSCARSSAFFGRTMLRPIYMTTFAFAIVLLLPATALQSVPALYPRPIFSVGTSPRSSAADDFNGDGRLDLVVACPGSSAISILLNSGPGTFASNVDYPIPSIPTASQCVDTGDFNADGRPDIAVVSGGMLAVMLASPTGSFGLAAYYPAHSNARAVAARDLNADGRLDLITANFSSGSISVLYGNGQGGFAVPVNYPAGAGAAYLAFGDLNRDGRQDLVIANLANSISVLLGSNSIGFGSPITFPVSGFPASLAVGDLNSDGNLDIAATTNPSGITVLPGDGLGSLGTGTTYSMPFNSTEIALTDLNTDGVLDVVTAIGSDSVAVLLGTAQGSLTPAVLFSAGVAIGLTAGDFTGDSVPDLAVLNGTSPGLVSLLVGDGHGAFPVSTGFAAGQVPRYAVTSDLNGDGRLDLVVVNEFTPGAVQVLLGNGAGGFGAPANYSVGNQPKAVVITDLNGDSLPDLATANYASNSVSVLLATGQGAFAASVSFLAWSFPIALASGDMDGDGSQDLVVANQTSPGSVSVLLGTGVGSFAPVSTFIGSEYPLDLTSGDLNGDNAPDVVMNNFTFPASVSVLLNNGQAGFGSATTFSAGTGIGSGSLALADVNGDSNLDLAVTSSAGSGTLSVLLGSGQGSFGSPTPFEVGSGAARVAIADLNGDGSLDATVTHATAGGGVSVSLGDGQGAFGLAFQYATEDDLSNAPAHVAIGDLNGDGRPDLAVPNGNDAVWVLINQLPALNGAPVCLGDGTQGNCPCSNSGFLGHGCQNSASTGGALLVSSGLAQLSNDSLVLAVSGELSTALSVFLQGSVSIPAVSFGDGLRCAGGTLKRLYVQNASGGATSAPGTGMPSVSAQSSALGDPLGSGVVRVYQVYYRDPDPIFCSLPGSSFNVSNGQRVTWSP